MEGFTHHVTGGCIIRGITPNEFIRRYCHQESDLKKLIEIFSTYCDDYNAIFNTRDVFWSAEFCARMLYDIGPEIKKTKQMNKCIRLNFIYSETKEHKVLKKTVLIFKNNEMVRDIESNGTMNLTLKQANLLATKVFCDIIPVEYANSAKFMMTPMCGAFFSRDSIPEMAELLKLPPHVVCQIINASAVPGGENLEYSEWACAAATIIAATTNVSNSMKRNQMINKVTKKYMEKKKVLNKQHFAIYCKFVVSGLPSESYAEPLLSVLKNTEEIDIYPRTIAEAMGQAIPDAKRTTREDSTTTEQFSPSTSTL